MKYTQKTWVQFSIVSLIGFICSLTFFLPNMIIHHGIFLLKSDYIHQQIPFYLEARRMILSGSPFWSWNTELGANFIGSYAFYSLGSPFLWFTILFPEETIPYLLGWILILKISLSAGTAFLFIKLFNKNWIYSAIGALLYSFCSNIMVALPFNHFHESYIMFPLLLYSLERLIKDNKKGLFSIIVTLSALSNYYLFFGQTVFLAIYSVIRILSKEWSKNWLSRILYAILEYCCGILCSGILLVPAFFVTLSSPRVDFDLLLLLKFIYPLQFIISIISAFLFPSVASWHTTPFTRGWTSVAFAMPVWGITGVIAFIKNNSIKNWIYKLLIILTIMSFVPFLNSLFIGMQLDIYYYRWWYMFVLIASLATSQIISLEDKNLKKDIIFISALASFTFCIPPTLKYINLFLSADTQGNSNEALIYYIKIILCISTIICIVANHIALIFAWGIVKFKKMSYEVIAIICIVLSVLINGNFYTFLHNKYADFDAINNKENSLFYYNLVFGKSKVLPPTDTSVSRLDYSYELLNLSMILDRPSVVGFHSLMNASSIEFGTLLNYRRSFSPLSAVPTSQKGLQSLFSVKWFINTTSNRLVNESWLKLVKKYDTYELYENTLYIPFGFTYDKYIDKDFLLQNPKSANDLILAGIALDKSQINKYKDILSPLDTSNIPSIEYLVGERKKEVCDYFNIKPWGFEASITLPREKLLFFSVPFDNGWRAEVNGVPCEIEKSNIGFMSIKVPSGVNKIIFTYSTPGLNIGIICSVIGLILFILLNITRLFLKSNTIQASNNI